MDERSCTIDGCTRKLRARGWCATHHQRWRMHGDPNVVIVRTRKTCSVEACNVPAWSKGLCTTHLSRWKKTGSTDAPVPPTVAERFWAKVNLLGPEPDYAPHLGRCWLWAASANEQGYGHFTPQKNKRSLCAHRWSYQQLVGPIPEGLHLDHLCRVPACVNPSHLEPVTPFENTRRGIEARRSAA